MKDLDIRKIYICEISKQKDIEVIHDEDPYDMLAVLDGPTYKWSYEDNSCLGLFTKTLLGYKHILTNKIYPKASHKTGNKLIIKPKNIKKLVKYNKELAYALLQKNNSYNLDIETVEQIEKNLNEKFKQKDTEKEM